MKIDACSSTHINKKEKYFLLRLRGNSHKYSLNFLTYTAIHKEFAGENLPFTILFSAIDKKIKSRKKKKEGKKNFHINAVLCEEQHATCSTTKEIWK